MLRYVTLWLKGEPSIKDYKFWKKEAKYNMKRGDLTLAEENIRLAKTILEEAGLEPTAKLRRTEGKLYKMRIKRAKEDFFTSGCDETYLQELAKTVEEAWEVGVRGREIRRVVGRAVKKKLIEFYLGLMDRELKEEVNSSPESEESETRIVNYMKAIWRLGGDIPANILSKFSDKFYPEAGDYLVCSEYSLLPHKKEYEYNRERPG